MVGFKDLPDDILFLIAPYLEPAEFLALCSTCQDLAVLRHESSYWSYRTRFTFRVPNRPVIQSDGVRWQSLYKRLRTQSKVYTWGQDKNGCLGRGVDSAAPPTAGLIARRGPRMFVQPPTVPRKTKSTWPAEMSTPVEIGIIADLQCGGWSTSVLNHRGVIYSVGLMNGMNRHDFQSQLAPLRFPFAHDQPSSAYDAHTAIKQFSSGRTHVLGLSDNGTIWAWNDIRKNAWSIDVSDYQGPVLNVVAGWNKSSANIRGLGIVLWEIATGSGEPEERVFTPDMIIIPKSGYRRPRGKQQTKNAKPTDDELSLRDTIGEVTTYIVLENYVVFVTHLSKAFACQIRHDSNSGVIYDIFELTDLPDAKDVQGAFRTFAIFKGKGEVHIADQAYLDACSLRAFQHGENHPLPPLTTIPALQGTGVVQLAFGDYHYHALHTDGSITSYGVEPGMCGALGLGGGPDEFLGTGEILEPLNGSIRGIKYKSSNLDGVLLPHAYYKGRRIWFQKEKEIWTKFIGAGGKHKLEAHDRMRLCRTDPSVQGEVSEWMEQKGSSWDKRPEVQKIDEDGLGAHFALSVAAAGWHSGALVLVNDKVVDAVRESCLVDDVDAEQEAEAGPSNEQPQGMVTHLTNLARNFLGLRANSVSDEDEEEHPHTPPKGKKWIWADDSFPRLRLENEEDMPGSVDIFEWKEPKPDWKLNWKGADFTGKVFGVSGWEVTP